MLSTPDTSFEANRSQEQQPPFLFSTVAVCRAGFPAAPPSGGLVTTMGGIRPGSRVITGLGGWTSGWFWPGETVAWRAKNQERVADVRIGLTWELSEFKRTDCTASFE